MKKHILSVVTVISLILSLGWSSPPALYAGGGVAVSLPVDATGANGAAVTVPITVGDTTGQGIISFDATITFNSAVLNATSVTASGVTTGWSVTANTSVAGQVTISAFNAAPLSGSGTLVNIAFNVVGSLGSTSALTFSSFIFNEDVSLATTSNGLFTIPSGTPTPTSTATTPPTATSTATATSTPTATPTDIPTLPPVPTATSTGTSTATATSTPTTPPTATSTATTPPTATATGTTPPTPTATPTNTPVVPTNTPTNTPVGPTNTPTNTPVVPTNTPTNTPVVPTNTPTNTPVVPTNTPTNTPVGPTNTPTNTPVGPTNTPTNTPVGPTNTPTNTPVGPTNTPTATPTATLVPDATATVAPNAPVTIIVTVEPGNAITIAVPAGAVTESITLAYTDLPNAPAAPPAGFQFGNKVFDLDALRNGTVLDDFGFQQPVVITLDYSDEDVAGLDEANLVIYYYDEDTSTWRTDGINVIERDTVNNRIRFTITHLTVFGLFAPQVTPTPTPTATTVPSKDVLYLSPRSNSRIGNFRFHKEDIISYNTITGVWRMVFDGSDVGVGRANLDAFSIQADGSILMSFDKGLRMVIDGQLTTVDDSDVVRFTPTKLGDNTSGSFTSYLRGATIELTSNGEDIDALSMDDAGNLLFSTSGTLKTSSLLGGDEDLFKVNSANQLSIFFDGSDVKLTAGSEDITGVWMQEDELYLTTKGRFNAQGSVNTVAGSAQDIFVCQLLSSGPTTDCSFSIFMSVRNAGLRVAIDGLHIGGEILSSHLTATEATSEPEDDSVEQYEVIEDAVTDEADVELDDFDLSTGDEEVLETSIFVPMILTD